MFHHSDNLPFISPFIPSLIFLLIAAIYVAAVIRQHYQRYYWSLWRSASFILGLALLGVALSPPVTVLAHQDIRIHMVQHILIGMLAPLALMLASPLTLALRSFPVTISRRIVRVLHSSFVRWISHPATALTFNIGGMYLLYLSPLYRWSLTSPILHFLIHAHFFIAGYLFCWAIAGPDPAPRRPGFATRITVLFIGIAAHATLGKFMYAYLLPLNTPHSPEDIRSAAKIMYYGGDFAELLLAIVSMTSWYGKGKLRPYAQGRPFKSRLFAQDSRRK